MRPVYNRVLVQVDYEWKEEHVTQSGVIGVCFQNDIDRSVGAQRKGKVIAIPRAISKNHFFLKDIQEAVRVGDILYFHFNSILPDNCVDPDKGHYIINMEQIFCILRDGEMIMYGGRVLAEPIYDDDVEDEGGIKVRKTASGIIKEINVQHNLKKAKLSYIGNPLRGERTLDVSPGDTIYYDTDADFENVIEGKKYFCMIQEDILMKEM
jgi:co-chaperonin GroES (HSP10)